MKVKQIKQRGEPVWLVDGKINGKRKRMFFESEAKAKRWLAAEAKDTTCQQWWLDLNSGQRADMMNAFMRAEDEGFKLLTAVSHYTEQGRGQLFLKRITLGEAVGTLTFHPSRYDEGFKKDTVKDSSGYFRTRVAKGCSMKTLYTKRCVLFNFRDFVGDKKQVATITVEDIEGWLDAGGCKGKQWTPVTKENYASDVKAFFNWLKKRKHVSENPCDAMEQILDIEMEPEILTPKQCEELLKTTLEVDRTMLSYIVLMLFCGIRPSEAMRLKSSAI